MKDIYLVVKLAGKEESVTVFRPEGVVRAGKEAIPVDAMLEVIPGRIVCQGRSMDDVMRAIGEAALESQGR